MTTAFLIDDGREDANTTKNGPSSAMRFAGGPMMTQQ